MAKAAGGGAPAGGTTAGDAGGDQGAKATAAAASRPTALPPGDTPGEPGPWVNGRLSRMRSRPLRMPTHDRDYGATELELQSRAAGGATDRRTRETGVWTILAYLDDAGAGAGAYLLGGIFQSGAWLPLRRLVYLDERTGARRDSRVTGTDWMAMAAVQSPNGHFVAFVAVDGAVDGDTFHLQVLDTRTDRVVRLGKPPLPPPMDEADADLCTPDRTFAWGDLADGFLELDRGIVTFPDERTLAVSYGRDTCRHRARQRSVRRWDLPASFARDRPLYRKARAKTPTVR